MTRVLLVSTYELGHQPLGLASPAAWLRRAGVEVACLDLSRQPFDADLVAADIVAFHLPMHTATRLAVPVIERIRHLNPQTDICAYGLYAPLNEKLLRSRGVSHVLGPEFEQALVDLATASDRPGQTHDVGVPRLVHPVPDRRTLLPLAEYATLQLGRDRRLAGYTEASRGCKHFCSHCPIVPIYNGRFRVIAVDTVLEDIRRQVESGAEHITFGDPDFFNGIGHATRIIERLAHEFPGLSYDVTVKIEHLIRHRDVLAALRRSGCILVTSAVESFDNVVLGALQKGHTRDDIDVALTACRQVGLTLAPTFVAFTPWTTVDGYCRFLAEIDRRGLVDQVAPIQLGLRLLVPEGSLLIAHPAVRPRLEPFDPSTLVYPWRHPDPKVDDCSAAVAAMIGRRISASRQEVFDEVWRLAHEHAARAPAVRSPQPHRRTDVPYLNEPWYC